MTALSHSQHKREDALAMGAHCFQSIDDEESLAELSGAFDYILSTINVAQNWDLYLALLKPKGRLHFVGVLLPLTVAAFPLLAGQKSISGSPVGSPVTIATMLEFAARHQIKPQVEVFKFSQVNEAIAHLRSGKARYRIVLEH